MKRSRSRRQSLKGLVCLGLLWGGLSGASANEIDPPPHIQAALSVARQLNDAFVYVADTVSPSVTVIKVSKKAGAMEDLEGHPLFDELTEEWKEQLRERWRREGERRERGERDFSGQGSGVVMRKDGYILTNHHVIEDAEDIRIRLIDGREFAATIRGTDPDSDLAILQITEPPDDLKPVRFADSQKVRVGEFAIAIGAPFELDYSLTFGHVSAKGREDIVGGMMMDQDFIQTDANINPGNSGGPLVNLEGEVIGINALIRGMRSGIGFAIPASIAKEVGDQLIEHGRFRRSWLGVGILSLRDDQARQRQETNVDDGIIVTQIHNGPAAKSELRRNDIIVAVDDRPVATIQQLRNIITRKSPGTDVVLDVFRRGHRRQVIVNLEEMPDRSIILTRMQRPNTPQDPADPGRLFGIRVEALNPGLAGRFELSRTSGVVITQIEPELPAKNAGLLEGDVILEIAGQSVTTIDDFTLATDRLKEATETEIRYERQGEPATVTLRWTSTP